jgi:hypothetical protein
LAGLLVAATLVAAAWLVLARDSGRLAYSVPPGHAQNQLTLLVSGANIEPLDGATSAVLQSRPLAGTYSVSIQGAPGNVDDSLTVTPRPYSQAERPTRAGRLAAERFGRRSHPSLILQPELDNKPKPVKWGWRIEITGTN